MSDHSDKLTGRRIYHPDKAKAISGIVGTLDINQTFDPRPQRGRFQKSIQSRVGFTEDMMLVAEVFTNPKLKEFFDEAFIGAVILNDTSFKDKGLELEIIENIRSISGVVTGKDIQDPEFAEEEEDLDSTERQGLGLEELVGQDQVIEMFNTEKQKYITLCGEAKFDNVDDALKDMNWRGKIAKGKARIVAPPVAEVNLDYGEE